MRLHQQQREFIAFLRDAPHSLPPQITVGRRLDVARQLAIYHHAYRARLLEVLQDVFERTWAYLGDAAFGAAVEGFLAAHPPAEPTLQHFGAAFPDWLRTRFPDDTDIAEVARLDAMLRTAFDSADVAPLTPADLSALDADAWSRVGFRFHPSVALAPMRSNAAGIWKALDCGETPPPVRWFRHGICLVVWRRQFQPHFTTIGMFESHAIALLREGRSFAATCEALAAAHPQADVPVRAGMALRRWLDEGMLAAVVGG